MQLEPQTEIIWRLHTAAGHLCAISELVEAGKPCEEVLHQLGAVRAALRAIGAKILVSQLEQSKEIILFSNDVEMRVDELSRLYSLYQILVHDSNYDSEANK
jgi:DNA-binding FrmR family transcriptional regulator